MAAPHRDGLRSGVFDSPSWLSENGRPSMAGPLTGLIRPKPFASAGSASRHGPPAIPHVEVREGRAVSGPAHALPRCCLGLVQSRGLSASSATCGTERCGRTRPAGDRPWPVVFAKAAGRLENPRPQRGRAGAKPSEKAAQRPLPPSAGVTGATRLIAPGSCGHVRAQVSGNAEGEPKKRPPRRSSFSFTAAGGSALASLETRVALADYERFAATTNDLAVTVPQLGGLQG
jgi:hypothetical protein